MLKSKDSTLLEQYFKDIIYRDIIARFSIRNIKEFKELCLYLCSNIATIYSYENLKDIINAKNITTIKNYLGYLEDVFLFFRLSLFDYSIKRQIYNPWKFYIVDIGLSQTIGFKTFLKIVHIYENLVFLELKRQNKDIFYWKSKDGKEVDFIVKEGIKITEAIQVWYDINNPKTKEREISALISVYKELKPDRCLIITKDEEKEEKIGKLKIKIIPLWKWLLQEQRD